MRTWSGDLAGVPVTIALTGEGAKNAQRAAEAIVSTGPRLLVALGLAGALDPQLKPADLVVATRVVRDGLPPLRIDDDLLAHVRHRTGAAPGWVATVDRIVSSVRDKRSLQQRWAHPLHATGSGPGLVDLESRWAVEAAERGGVPWVVLRAVSDVASENLPEFLEQARDEDGAIRRHRVLLHAMHHPRWVPGLVRLGWRSRRCARVLAEAVERLVTDVSASAPR
jgi:adenosylhomocysteine nucleosidase